jgi:Zn-dependent peptidase ImmA (M78 family)
MPTPDYKKVERAVRNILQDCGIDEPPVDPIRIAHSKGIAVKSALFSGKHAGIAGFYDPVDHTIIVNRDEFPLRQTFTIAHELGHAVLHREWANSEDYKVLWRDSEQNNNDYHEKEANVFAAHLLVPRSMLDRYYEDLTVSELSQLFAVSVPVIRNRLAFEYGI